MSTPSVPAREAILSRIRSALTTMSADDPKPGAAVARDYLTAHVSDGLVDLFAENVTDYRAHVHRASSAAAGDLAELVARLLPAASTRLVVPQGIPVAWIPESVELLRDDPPLTADALDSADAVLTTCALAIAETGTIVLDADPGQGRRALTLIPDHHICVIDVATQIVASLPQALPRLDPTRPLTWIAGPSATSDIELDRVEGVHGPRRLDVILI